MITLSNHALTKFYTIIGGEWVKRERYGYLSFERNKYAKKKKKVKYKFH